MKSSLKFLFFFVVLSLQTIAQGTYYNSISTSSSTFISDLQTRIRSPYTQVSYDAYKTTNIPNFASRDTTNGQKVVTCVYSGYNYVYTPPFAWIGGAGVIDSIGFSREHTWCHNWMPSNPADKPERKEYSDQHHLFPVNQNKANAVRSDHPLGNVVTLQSQYYQGKFGLNANGKVVYEPRSSHKGDAARAILYMALRYDGIDGYSWNFNTLKTRLAAINEDTVNLNTLLQWHQQDPPTKWEVDRNDYIQSIQGNRNPFTEHPEYVNYINFYDLTKTNPTYSTEPTNQPTNIVVSSITNSSFTVSWTAAAAGLQAPSGYLIELFNSNEYFIPIDGSVYSDDTNISNGKIIVNVSSGTASYSFTGLAAGTKYYIRMYPYNGTSSAINYNIDGTILSTTATTSGGTPTLAPEPTYYPKGFSNFTPTITDTSITVKWADTNGTVLASGYLLFANTTGIFTDPVDGVVYADDTNLSDGGAVVNIAYSAPDTFRFGGLIPATSYYFKLYPYNGDGTQRNYKTDSFPLSLSIIYITTGANQTYPSIVVNEYYNGSAAPEWIELLVLKDSLDLRNYKIRDYFSGGTYATNPLVFANVEFWSLVQKGSFIVIFTTGTNQPTADTDFSDKRVVIPYNDANYFSGPAFTIAGSNDAVEILDAGGTHVFSLSHGSYPGSIVSIPQPRVNVPGASSSGNIVRFVNTSSFANFLDSNYAQHSAGSNATMGAPNDAVQTTFVNTVLPVELNSFFALVQKNNVLLKWRTATESNNAGFEVERTPTQPSPLQEEGLGGGWKKIGFVDGNGSSPIPNQYSFEDENLNSGRYFYRLKQIDRDGSFTYSNEVEAIIGTLPKKFSLEQNYPNPFNPTTTINYSVGTVSSQFLILGEESASTFVSLKIYDVIGREISTLVNEPKVAGNYSVQFNGLSLPSGLYFAHLSFGGKRLSIKMILAK